MPARNNSFYRLALFASSILATCATSPAFAQLEVAPPGNTNDGGGPEPVPITNLRPIINEDGIDIATGEVKISAPSIQIGDLSFKESWSGDVSYNTLNSFLLEGLLSVVLFIDGESLKFTRVDALQNIYDENEANGDKLTKGTDGASFILMRSNGTRYEFVAAPDGVATSVTNFKGGGFKASRLKRIIYANGEEKTWHYRQETIETNCGTSGAQLPGGIQAINPNCVKETFERTQSITSNKGYMLKAEYLSNQPGEDFAKLVSVKAIDRSIDFCDPIADFCESLSRDWPELIMSEVLNAGTTERAVIDSLGDQFGAVVDDANKIQTVDIDRDGNNERTFTYYPDGRVRTYTANGLTYTLTYSREGDILTVTKTYGNGKSVVTKINQNINRPVSVIGADEEEVQYQYDNLDRLVSITFPEGNGVQYTYDDRNNIIETRRLSKSGSNLSTVTSAGFSETCANSLTCNKPLWTQNAIGARTDYSYDPATGNLLQVRLPASENTSQLRAEINYTYTNLYARIKDANGQYVNAESPLNLLTRITSCATAATCAGSADETVVTIEYGQASGANNLLPTKVTTSAGDGSISSTVTTTYDERENVASVDGPLPGAADTVYYFYDANNRRIGEIGPDPDDNGAILRRATRYSYNARDQITKVESGTATGTSRSALGAMTVHNVVEREYNNLNTIAVERVSSGGQAIALTQYQWANGERLLCTAQRMNPAAFGSLPNSACTVGTAGTFGPDRITRNSYDNADRVIRVETAVGTADASDEVLYSYTPNGQLATLTDGEGNVTTNEYDVFDRLRRTYFPSKTSAGVSSTTDYTQINYNAIDAVTSARLRDGQTINLSYDRLGRLKRKNLPGNEPDATYGYDLAGRLVSASQNGQTVNLSFDALGRNTGITDAFGTTAYQYDQAGRRKRLTWNDGYFVTYDWLNDGSLRRIRENGGAALATWSYDARGRQTRVQYGNGSRNEIAYGAQNRLDALTLNLSGTVNDNTTSFDYNPAGQITELTRSNPDYGWTGLYNVDRNYSVNGLNQITQAGALSLSYDGRGNLVGDGSNSYSYSSENYLTAGPDGLTLSYDPLGRLYETRKDGNAVTRFGYDGLDLIAEYDAAGNILRRYVHGPGVDDPILWYEGAGRGDKRYMHKDERGSVVALTKGDGSVLAINSYDEYGIPAQTNLGRFQYTGQTWLPELGMYYYKARIYSPTLGRFLQTDPIGYGDGVNIYAYVQGDPINYIDPYGLCSTTITFFDGNGDGKWQSGEEIVQITVNGDCGGGGSGGGGAFFNRNSPPTNGGNGLLGGGGGSGLLDDLVDTYCSLPSFGGGVSAGGYAGLGGGVTGEAAFDPSSGRISLSAGLNVGVGVGFSVAGTGNIGRGVSSAPVFGSVGVNANVAAGPVRAGVAGTLIDSSGFNPRYNGVNGGLRAGGGLTANANLTARGGTAFQILPSCE